MSDRLVRQLERVQQTRAARARQLEALTTRSPSPLAQLGAVHAPGDKVFDRVSGEVVEVIGVRRENVVVPSTK